MTPPARGFPLAEFHGRLRRAQGMMADAGLDALFLTTEPEVRYFTGFLTRFWESPTRPWMLVVPARGDPVAVIPAIGAHLMGQTWINDIRTWRAPDLNDDGVGLAAETLCDLVPQGGRIGVPSGMETHLRLPLDSWRALGAAVESRSFDGDADILRRLRMVIALSNSPRSASPAPSPTARSTACPRSPRRGFRWQRSFADSRCWRSPKARIGCPTLRAGRVRADTAM